MSAAIFFDRETFGVDRLVQAPGGISEPGGATKSAGCHPDVLRSSRRVPIPIHCTVWVSAPCRA